MALRELQHDLENQANALSKLQKDIGKNHQIRKQYTIQLGENELVLKELDILNESANVYKLIGPVLVKQDLAEARANVRKRIEYISAELKRLDGTLQDLEDKQNNKRDTMDPTESSHIRPTASLKRRKTASQSPLCRPIREREEEGVVGPEVDVDIPQLVGHGSARQKEEVLCQCRGCTDPTTQIEEETMEQPL